MAKSIIKLQYEGKDYEVVIADDGVPIMVWSVFKCSTGTSRRALWNQTIPIRIGSWNHRLLLAACKKWDQNHAG